MREVEDEWEDGLKEEEDGEDFLLEGAEVGAGEGAEGDWAAEEGLVDCGAEEEGEAGWWGGG